MQPDALCHRYLRQNRLICNIVLYLLNTKINLLWIMTTNWLLIYVYRLITRYRKLGKQQWLSVKVSMRWDEMRYIVANTTLNLCFGGLQEIGEVRRLETTLTKDGIAYHGSVGDVGPSTSILGPSTSVTSMSTSVPSPSTSWDDISPPQTYMDITDPTSSWTRWRNY